MRKLRYARIFLSLLFFIAAVVAIVVGNFDIAKFCKHLETFQIQPHILPSAVGVIIFWLLITFLFGRVYCSSVCPLGTFQDIISRICKMIPALKRDCSFKPSVPKRQKNAIIIYIICLLVGINIVPAIIEPWSMFQNIVSTFKFAPIAEDVIEVSINIISGFLIGFFSFVVIVIYAVFKGRDYCNEICPIGIFLGYVTNKSLMHIEINPDKCISCMECESGCKSSCIKVVSRYVDNSRCVRCFNCVNKCPNDAIRYQLNRNRVSTPMMRQVNNSVSEINKQ